MEKEEIKLDFTKITDIITDESLLGNRADEIDPRKQGKLVQQITLALKKIIREKGINALSAPAIGCPYRIFCISFDKGTNIKTFINPIISDAEGFEFARESCTSLPNREFIRPRNNKVTFTYMSPMGKIETRKVAGYTAHVIQHEIDHLDGLLLSDIGLEIDEQFDKASEDERNEVLQAYMDALDIKRTKLTEEIKADKELSQLSDAIDFMTGVATGKIQAEKVSIDKEEAEEIRKLNTPNEESPAPVKKKRGRPKKSETN